MSKDIKVYKDIFEIKDLCIKKYNFLEKQGTLCSHFNHSQKITKYAK